MSKSHFVLLTKKYPPPFTGGSRRFLYEVFSRFSNDQLTVFTKPASPESHQELREGPRLIRRRYIYDYLTPAGRVYRKFRALRMHVLVPIDLFWYSLRRRPACLILGEFYPFGLTAIVLKRLLKLPYVVFAYGEELAGFEQNGGRRWTGLKATLRNADRVMAISSFTVHQLKKMGVDPDRISLAFPAVDSHYFHPQINAAAFRSGLGSQNDKILVTISRLSERKGQAEVIRVLPRVLAHVPELRYVMIGPDPKNHSPKLLELAKTLGIENHVTYLGAIDEADIPKAYAACDVFVMAAHEVPETKDIEGFGMVFLEANACGKPVIGGRAGGTVDAIEDGKSGLLVDATNPDELAHAIITLLTDSEYAQQLGHYGRERVVERFNWDKTVSDVKQAVSEVAR